jgi:small-conductance mechanosensitive channel
MTLRKKRLLRLLIIILFGVVFLYCVSDYLTVDKCLDNGGLWNYEKHVCERE